MQNRQRIADLPAVHLQVRRQGPRHLGHEHSTGYRTPLRNRCSGRRAPSPRNGSDRGRSDRQSHAGFVERHGNDSSPVAGGPTICGVDHWGLGGSGFRHGIIVPEWTRLSPDQVPHQLPIIQGFQCSAALLSMISAYSPSAAAIALQFPAGPTDPGRGQRATGRHRDGGLGRREGAPAVRRASVLHARLGT